MKANLSLYQFVLIAIMKHHRFKSCNSIFVLIFMLFLFLISCKHKALPNQYMIDLLKAQEKMIQC